MKKRLKLLVLGSIVLGLSLGLRARASGIDDGTQLGGLGRVKDAWSRVLDQGINYSRIDSTNYSGNQITHMIDLNTNEYGLKPVVSYGPSVMGFRNLESHVRSYEDMGYRVVFAINGDSFFGTGTPKGVMIKDGIIHSTGASYLTSLGFDENNQPVYGNPGLGVRVDIAGTNIPISEINTARGKDQRPAYLLTPSFASSTRTTAKGIEVLVKMDDEGFMGPRVNSTSTGRVVGVYKEGAKPSNNQVSLKKGHALITVGPGSPQFSKLANAKEGQEVRLIVVGSKRWDNVRDALGVFRPIKENGKYTNRAKATDIQPRTTVALKKDGSFRIMENDGRLRSARGLSYKDLVDFLSIGSYDTILAFDGGGSSTIYTTKPGYDKAARLNTPSDGRERGLGNALLFVRKREKGQSADRLHIYPDGYAKNELTMDIGKKIYLDTKATDNAYNTADIDISQLVYESDLGHGRGDWFLAEKQGDSMIRASYPSGARGSIKLRVVNRVGALTAQPQALKLAPGQSFDLKIMAKAGNESYSPHLSMVTFENSSPDLLYFKNGKGQALAEGSGVITASFAGKTIDIGFEIKEEKVIARYEGENRYKTAAKIAERFGQADTVLLAKSDSFPDALVASSLADKYRAPILLTDGNSLAPETKDAMASLGAKRVIVLGGANSISQDLEDSLKSNGLEVQRLAGDNRYQTARLIASQVETKGHIYLASGENYPDALAITGLAAKTKDPILLTPKAGLAREVRDFIGEKSITSITIAGGPGAISPAVEEDLRNMGLEVTRISGSNRYETSAKISAMAYPKERGMIIASGEGFIDALAAGPLAALTQRPIVLSSKSALDPSVRDLLKGSPRDRTIMIGGTNTLDQNLKSQIQGLVD